MNDLKVLLHRNKNAQSEKFSTHCASQEFIVWISNQKICRMECWVKDSIKLKVQNEYDNIHTRTRSPVLGWYKSSLGPLHVLWQVSFGCWVTWSISSWRKYYKSVFFPKSEWWVAELLFLPLNNWGLNSLQNECSQSSQIYLSPEKLRKMFTFQSCKFLNDRIKLPCAK